MTGFPVRKLSLGYRFLLCLFALHSAAVLPTVAGAPDDAAPVWTKALAGEIVAGPVSRGERIYLVSADRKLTCLSDSGTFLWSRPLPGPPAPFLALDAGGMVFALAEPGSITACNGNGSFLWQLGRHELPLFSPVCGRDGRIFLVYRHEVCCVSAAGAIKWTLPIDREPAFPPSETGDGDLLVPCSGNIILRISPFGGELERIAVPVGLTALSPLAGGFVAGFGSGGLECFDVRNGRGQPGRTDSEVVWRYQGSAPPLVLLQADRVLLSVQEDGTVNALNPTDGSTLWATRPGTGGTATVFVSCDYGQFNIVMPGFAGSLSLSGVPGWLCSAWRGETRILTEKKNKKASTYAILKGPSLESGLPYIGGTLYWRDFLDRVADGIESGTVGVREPVWARRLRDILEDGSADGPVRGRAASLLGQLGSSEYRSLLVSEAERALTGESVDSSLAAGLLYGIAASGSDREGLALETVRKMIRKTDSNGLPVLMAACDALYAIIRYSEGERAVETTRFLTGFLGEEYPPAVRNHARAVLARVLQ